MKSIRKELIYWKTKFKMAKAGNVPRDKHYSDGMCDGLNLALRCIKEKNNKKLKIDTKPKCDSCDAWNATIIGMLFCPRCGRALSDLT